MERRPLKPARSPRTLDPVGFAAAGTTEGRAWMSTVPALTARLCGEWALHAEDATSWHGYNAIVTRVRRGAERCVLKLTWPEERAALEARALEAWNGRGAVRLLAARPALGALLLERLDGERTLRSLDLWEAAEVAGALLRRLAIPAPGGFPLLRVLAEGIAGSLRARQERLGHPVAARWCDAARSLARDLGASAGDRLVHADLHYENVLAGGRDPWLAIDPRPVAGSPEYAVPELLWTRLDEAGGAAAIRRLLAAVVKSAGLDAEVARGWVIVRCVDYWLWGLENALTEDPVRCARILAALG